MKRAAADIWWVIISAALALVVFVVLILSFTRGTSPIIKGLSACQDQGGLCSSSGCPQGTTKTSAFSCKQGEKCCLGIPKECEPDGSCREGRCVFYGDADQWYCQ